MFGVFVFCLFILGKKALCYDSMTELITYLLLLGCFGIYFIAYIVHILGCLVHGFLVGRYGRGI